MNYHVLLLEDVLNHGRKGDLTHVKPGFARNCLLPQGKAILASKSTIKLRERLQKERLEQAAEDRKESEALAKTLQGKMFETVVKVDPEGHMYGSVTAQDIAAILQKEGHAIDKKHIALSHPIKQIGNHQVRLLLPEEVEGSVGLTVKPDREIKPKAAKKKTEEEKSEEEASKDEAPAEEEAEKKEEEK